MCLFPPLIWALVAGGAFIPVAATYIIFPNITLQSFQFTKSHTSTTESGRSRHIMHRRSFWACDTVPHFWCCIYNRLWKAAFIPLIWKSRQTRREEKRPPRSHCSRDKEIFFFFVNSNLSLTLIGPLSPQQSSWLMKRFGLKKKKKKIDGVLVLPTTDKTQLQMQLPCESWSRKWIGISFNGHERLLQRFSRGL